MTNTLNSDRELKTQEYYLYIISLLVRISGLFYCISSKKGQICIKMLLAMKNCWKLLKHMKWPTIQQNQSVRVLTLTYGSRSGWSVWPRRWAAWRSSPSCLWGQWTWGWRWSRWTLRTQKDSTRLVPQRVCGVNATTTERLLESVTEWHLHSQLNLYHIKRSHCSPIWDWATMVDLRSHSGENGNPSSASLSP